MPVLTCFFCNDTAPTEIYTLSLHDALPIYLIVELSGPEPPILDGSVQPYFEALEQAGPTETGGEPVILSVQAPFTVTEGDASYIVAPAKELRLTVTIEWPHPLIGRQAGTYTVTPQAFARDLAPARTFGFTSEVAGLQAKGLIKGEIGRAHV